MVSVIMFGNVFWLPVENCHCVLVVSSGIVWLGVCSGTVGTVWYTLDGYCATLKALCIKGFMVSGTVGTHFSQTYRI